jgi:ubiquinone biosynthesis protein
MSHPSILQKLKNIRRLSQIVNILARYGFHREIQNVELEHLIHPGMTRSKTSASLNRAQRLARAFEELGPTFVKLAQLLATREDLLPKRFVEEFKRLQDRVRPCLPEQVQQVLEKELTAEQLKLIRTFHETPIGSASIGQVHAAQLNDGKNVVFKIQRPDVEIVIKQDLSILMVIANLLEATLPELKAIKPTLIIEELKRALQNELDYLREAANTERMRSFFEENNSIVIPKIYYELCSPKILCMEHIMGQKIQDSEHAPHNLEIIRIGVEAFLDMIFRFGVFHADLHPGNLLVVENNKLAILDFGLTARLNRDTRNTMAYMLLALSRQDTDSFSVLFLDLIEITDHDKRQEIERDVRDIIEGALSLPVQGVRLGRLLMRMARACASKGAPVSRELVLFFRALIALESFGSALDNKTHVLELALRYAEKTSVVHFGKDWFERNSTLMLRDAEILMRELPMTLRVFARYIQSGNIPLNLRCENLQDLTHELQRSSNRLSLSILMGMLVLGSSIATYGKQGPLYDLLVTLEVVAFGIAMLFSLWLAIGILRSGRFK